MSPGEGSADPMMADPKTDIGEELLYLSRTDDWGDYLERYRRIVGLALPGMLQGRLPELSHMISLPRKTYDILEKYAEGGKKFRGALVLLGYQCFDEDCLADIVRASVAYELIHAAFLVHDDIMDKSLTRRGQPTAHREFGEIAAEYAISDPEQFGLSMAINTGDMGPALAYDVVCSEPVSSERKVAAIKHLNAVIMDTVRGQSLDVGTSMGNMPTVEDILEIHKLKTALYTVSGALQFGGILAGGKETAGREARLCAMSSYGVPVGIAFQIQDDYLGTFSTEEKLGKSVTSDLAENKNTLLFLYTLQHGDAEQRAVLRASLGNRDIGQEELSAARRAIEGSGAVEYSRRQAAKLVEEGKRHVEEIAATPRLRRLLNEGADFVIGRKN